MATDYACHAAIEQAGRSLAPALGHTDEDAEGAGLAVLMEVLDGLYADLNGRLAQWHVGLDERLAALGLGDDDQRRPRRPSSLDALAVVQARSQDVLTVLLSRPRSAQAAAGELTARLTLVQDALSGTLRRAAVPAETAVQCAAGAALAAGSLFGARPHPAPPLGPDAAADAAQDPGPARQPEAERPPKPVDHSLAKLPDWFNGLP